MDGEDSTLDELIARAEDLEQTGQNEEAVSAWREAVKYRTTPYLLYRFGRLAIDFADWVEVEQSLLSAIDLAPDFPFPYTALGGFYLERENYKLGESLLTEGLKLWVAQGYHIPETAAPYTLLGTAQK